jgi:adhesin HecA-like repeat protein
VQKELFSDGPDVGSGYFLVGSEDLKPERSYGLDLTLRKETGKVTGSTTLGNSSTINTGGGTVTLQGAVAGDADPTVETLTINGASTLTMNNAGNTNLGSINLTNVGSILINYSGNLVLNADTLVNGGTIQATGDMQLNSGTPNPGSLLPGPAGQNLILLDPSGKVLLGGTASSWSLNGSTTIPLSNFFVVTSGTGVSVGPTTVVAGTADLFQLNVAASGQASAVAAPGAARQMVAACTLPMITCPSAAEVRLSGVMCSPWMRISAGGAAAAGAVGAATSATGAASFFAQPAAASATSTATEILVAFMSVVP